MRNENRVRNPFVPWYGCENMETDAPIMTHCGRTVDPTPMGGCREELGREVVLREAGILAQRFGTIRRAMSAREIRHAVVKKSRAARDREWSDWEI
jgi:hypothetical protein